MALSFTDQETARFMIILEEYADGIDSEKTAFDLCVADCFSCETLQWLHENGESWNHYTLEVAAEYSSIEIIKWLRDNGCPWIQGVVGIAAQDNHKVVKWLVDNGAPKDDTTMYFLAQNGDIDMVKYLRSKCWKWNSEDMVAAAVSGNLELVIWMAENGCPSRYLALREATRWGHVKVVKWLVNNGCRYDETLIDLANKYRRSKISDWLKQYHPQ